MPIPRATIVTLGVQDLKKATEFYAQVFGVRPNPVYEKEIAFFELPGTWVALYPLEKLADDIAPALSTRRNGFNGITIAYNARSQEEVIAIFKEVYALGGTVAKRPQETPWGGFSGYFRDLDGYYWEVAWGPMFEFTAEGELRFRKPG